MQLAKIILVLIFLTVPGYFIQSWYTNLEINPSLGVIGLIVLAKAAGTIYPPLPGIILTLSLIPVFGWAKAYLLEIIGSYLGMTTAYWLGSRYGQKILIFVIGDKLAAKIKTIKLKPLLF